MSLADDVLGAVGKGLVNEVVAVAGSALNSDEDIAVFHKPRIRSNPQRIS
jgi:hypothetical protein